ncbi:MAG: DUF4430 domain-containing protein [Acidobacteriota bacterium]
MRRLPSHRHPWVYLVNDQNSNVGFGVYRLSAGDVVVWQYMHISSGLRQATDPDAKAKAPAGVELLEWLGLGQRTMA